MMKIVNGSTPQICDVVPKNATNGETNNNLCNGLQANTLEGDYNYSGQDLSEDHNSTVVKCGDQEVPFAINSILLVKWYDGLYHPAKLKEVQVSDDMLKVEFDDGSEYLVQSSDVQWGALPKDDEIICSLCHMEHSVKPNQIVICDGCGLGFHQWCHHPQIQKDVVQSDDEWFCVLCSTRKNEIKTRTARMSRTKMPHQQQLRKALPYHPKTLHWDCNHWSNQENCYCYCGGPGQWYIKMIQCAKCKQWFHEACLNERPEKPLTCGDTYYFFMCSHCNTGNEILQKIDLRWQDIAHLAVFNLTMSRSKYADYDKDIMPWINSHWDSLNIGKLQSTPIGQRFSGILDALRANKNRFKNGREMKKRQAWFGLRTRATLPVPKLNLSTNAKTVSTAEVRQCLSKIENIEHLPPSSFGYSIKYYSKGAPKKRKCSFDGLEEPKHKKQKMSPKEIPKLNGSHELMCSTPKKNDLILPRPTPDLPSIKSMVDNQLSIDIFKEPKKRKHKMRNTLRRKIPQPESFTGMNNPFLTEIELKIMSDTDTSRKGLFDSFTGGLPKLDTPVENTTSVVSCLADNLLSVPLNGFKPKKRGRPSFRDIAEREALLSEQEDQGSPRTLSRSNSTTSSCTGSIAELRKSRNSQSCTVTTASTTVSSLQDCIYQGDALEWNEFQVRCCRKISEGKEEYLVEWYDDMNLESTPK